MITTYTETAHGIQLSVSTWFEEKKADLLLRQFSHAFRIHVQNERPEEIRLIYRRWIIDEKGKETRQIEGAGVAGRLPVIASGEALHYEVSVYFHTPTIRLKGIYLFQSVTAGTVFEVESPSFYISAHIFN